MSKNAPVQQALLKPEFAHIYRGIVPNEWRPANLMLEQVKALAPESRASSRLAVRDALDPTHFALRGIVSAGANEVARELKFGMRKRRPRK